MKINPLDVLDLSYNISRPVKIPWFKRLVIATLLFYIVIVTLINVVAQGYDTINYTSIDFNGTHRLWYDCFVPGRSSSYNHRSCEPALVKTNSYLATNSNYTFFLYQLVDFIDPTHNGAISSIDGLNYSNNPFLDCTVHSLSLAAYLNPVALELEAPGIIACNSTSNKYMYFQASSDAGLSSYLLSVVGGAATSDVTNFFQGFGQEPLDIQNSSLLMFAMARRIFSNLATYTTVLNQFQTKSSFLRSSLVQPNPPLSFLQFIYTDTFGGTTPANGTWNMTIAWQNITGPTTNVSYVAFLPTLGVDLSQSQNFEAANETVAPTVALIKLAASRANIANIDFWELINWVFVVQYWGMLLDFGQVSPTTWNWGPRGLENYGPISYSSTYNIFTNETLFQIYYNYMVSTILPLYGYSTIFPTFASPNDTNQLVPTNVSLRALYSCSDLELKSSQSLVISVMVADWAFVASLFTIVLIIATILEGRRNASANHCQGCDELRKQLIEAKLIVFKEETKDATIISQDHA